MRRRAPLEASHDVPRARLLAVSSRCVESRETRQRRAARCRLHVMLLVLITVILLAASINDHLRRPGTTSADPSDGAARLP